MSEWNKPAKDHQDNRNVAVMDYFTYFTVILEVLTGLLEYLNF